MINILLYNRIFIIINKNNYYSIIIIINILTLLEKYVHWY